jgi:hypothetical protein
MAALVDVDETGANPAGVGLEFRSTSKIFCNKGVGA